jgi:hypothetical protein
MKTKNKKAISEIVSYVLLIVIAMALAISVYSWLKIYVPSDTEPEECTDSTALYLKDYKCDNIQKVINISFENKGYFNIDGFFIKATNLTGTNLPTINLIANYSNALPGRYEFLIGKGSKLAPDEKTITTFSYKDLGSITKIHIQPFLIGQKSKMILPCTKTIQIDITNCD